VSGPDSLDDPVVPRPELLLPKGVAYRFEDGALRIALSLDTYRLEAIFRSCYWLTDRCFVYLGPPREGVIEVTLIAKSRSDKDTDRLTWQFLNDLVDQQLRISINEETRTIREMIVAQAFADTDLIDDQGKPVNQSGLGDRRPNDDPEGMRQWRPVS
jgi:His-Xaa-Ser system protein HxsD